MSTPNHHEFINVQGAREHNLKDLSVQIPKYKMVVFTGLSGSGKSSLAFDTLYAEGQRRYVESLSSYARQFLGIMHKPEVDHIEGLSPAISIDQKTTSHNPRSTVGTITEIYDYLRLLFARAGRPHCPNCGREVAAQSIDQIINQILEEVETRANSQPVRLAIMSPVVRQRKGEFTGLFDNLLRKGYRRARIDGGYFDLSGDLVLLKTNKHDVSVIIDRLTIDKKQLRDEAMLKTFRSRLTQSVEEALSLAEGLAIAAYIEDDSLSFPDSPKATTDRLYSEKRACSYCGISLPELEPRLFSFNSPQGACPECHGLGSLLKIDINKILAPTLTLSEGAIIPFARVLGHDSWWGRLVGEVVSDLGYDLRKTPWEEMAQKDQQILLYGSSKVYKVEGDNRFGQQTVTHQTFEGFISNLERRYQETDSDFMRKEIEQFMQKQQCPVCNGTRLKPEALSVKVANLNISEVTAKPINYTLDWTKSLKENLHLSPKEQIIAQPILKEIINRLSFLTSVGLTYLSLDREAGTLAGGEAQRIRLASQIGTGLTGVLYILDEPTIGLHQRDNHQLIQTLENLRDKGNSVIVVEHDRDVMLAADYIFDFGPLAGKGGGEIIAHGTPQELMADPASLTGKYLSRKKDVLRKIVKRERKIVSDDEIDSSKEVSGSVISINGATHNNLKNIDVEFPLGKFTAITGVSGSGKSTLLYDTLYANLNKHLGRSNDDQPGQIARISVPEVVRRVSLIDQSPIGKTPRSNPATYTKIFDHVRKTFALTKEAAVRGYKEGRFSFNVKGGRCEACQGDGQIKIEMQFLPDVYVTCDVCHGSRYAQETLEVVYQGKNIAQVLEMTVDEATDFFKNHTAIRKKLETLQAVGLGYIHLGQPAPTLSGGEAQRVKLAKELSARSFEHVVYLLDEPTTGLHFADVQNLLHVLHKLVEQNNSVIVIEHNLDIIKNADWIIDMGPEGGEAGGQVVATGTPAQVAANPSSVTGEYLKTELAATNS